MKLVNIILTNATLSRNFHFPAFSKQNMTYKTGVVITRFILWSQNDTWQWICDSYAILIKAHFSIIKVVRKFYSLLMKALDLCNLVKSQRKKHLINYAQILFIDQ